MWQKDGKVFVNPLRTADQVVYNPTSEQLTQAGYVNTGLPAKTREEMQAARDKRVAFELVKAAFWSYVDAAALAINAVKTTGAPDLTRADFPTSAYSAELLAWCTEHGLDAATTGDLAVKFCGISADLTRLGKNWGDLFDE